jgi:hypothetical protein
MRSSGNGSLIAIESAWVACCGRKVVCGFAFRVEREVVAAEQPDPAGGFRLRRPVPCITANKVQDYRHLPNPGIDTSLRSCPDPGEEQRKEFPMKGRLARLAAVGCAATAASVLGAMPAAAHNAGHIFLPSGACVEIGSLKESPGDLDLIPETPDPPFDEYGASFAGSQGSTPIIPGACP